MTVKIVTGQARCPLCDVEFLGYSTILLGEAPNRLVYETKGHCPSCRGLWHVGYDVTTRDGEGE